MRPQSSRHRSTLAARANGRSGMWLKRLHERGHVGHDAKGGDNQSWRIEAERERIFLLLEARPGLSIHALRKALAAGGLVFGFGSVQRFLKRDGLERKSRIAAAGGRFSYPVGPDAVFRVRSGSRPGDAVRWPARRSAR